MLSPEDLLRARVLVLMPSVRDSERTATLLGEGSVPSIVCADLATLCREMRRGVDAVILTDDIIFGDHAGQLAEAMRAEPAWSSVPLVVIAREGATQRVLERASDAITGIIVVERPVRTRSLLSVVVSAIRGRRHQYQIRDAILAREEQAQILKAQEERLREQADRLRATDRRKDEFLATLAHELRNPLAPIRIGLEVMMTSKEEAVIERTIGVMSRQLTHMVHLIDDLLDVSRITRGMLELKRERVSLGSFIDAAVEASKPQIDSRGHSFEVTIDDPGALVDVDPTRMAQVVTNLLNNASKYTPHGGKLALTVSARGSDVIIEMQDTGIGLTRDRLTDVFEMFNQVDSAIERSQGGLGIGLALVRSLVELHGGSVSAASEGAGRGSTFTVWLPAIVTRNADTIRPKASQTDRPTDRQRVLIVDDNFDAADLLSVMLERAGYQTATAYDGKTAIAKAGEYAPHIVILDIGLPGANGYDVARELRKIEHLAPLGLIALTGWGTREDKKKAMAAGFDVHLTKPVDAPLLHEALAEVSRRGKPSSQNGRDIARR